MNNPKFGTIFWWLLVVFFLIWIRAQFGRAQTLVRANHDSFVSYYDVETHNPALVCYVLEVSHFAGVNKVASNRFKMDTKLPRPRIKDDDYKNWSYVRGHLCSAGDRDSNKKWLKETYLTSNLVPMTMYCNAGAWRKVEDSCRAVAMQGHRLKVCRLPLYERSSEDGMTRGPNELRPQTVRDTKQQLSSVNVLRPAVPSAFLCLACCLDCTVRLSLCVTQSGTYYALDPHGGNLVYQNDPRVSVLLFNILGSWSREEYETITR